MPSERAETLKRPARFGASRKCREASEIPEDGNYFAALPEKRSLVTRIFDEFCHLRSQKPFQAVDALGFFLRDREFARHLVEPAG